MWKSKKYAFELADGRKNITVDQFENLFFTFSFFEGAFLTE